MISKVLGIIGGVCFGACGVPAAFATFKAKKSIGTPISVALLIFFGAITMYGYILSTYGFDLLLTLNYSIEALSWGTISYFHFFPVQVATKSVEQILSEGEINNGTLNNR